MLKKEFYISNLANGCIQMSDAIEEHIANGVERNSVTNISATVNNSRPLPMKAGRGPACLAGRVFSRGKRDSPSPNACRFHRGVSDVSFCTSGTTGDSRPVLPEPGKSTQLGEYLPE